MFIMYGCVVFTVLSFIKYLWIYCIPQRKHRVNKYHNLILKNTASIDSFALMVGKLIDKIDKFYVRIADMENYLYNEVPCDIDHIKDEIAETISDLSSKIEQTVEASEEKIEERVKIIYNNLTVLDNKIRIFSNNEYSLFKNDVISKLKNLENAIFVPLDDDDDNSDYQP